MQGIRLTGWRKVAHALWDDPNDPQIYGALELDAAPIGAYVRAARAEGHHVTATHLVGRAVAHALRAVPDLNVRVVGDRAIPRPSVDVFFITAISAGHDLSGVKVVGVDEKSAVAVADELAHRSGELKSGRDPDFEATKRITDLLPGPVLRAGLRFAAWLTGNLGLGIPALSLPASPFGSAMVSSVGMLGIPTGFSPLAWMYKVPLLVLVGEITNKPVVVGDRVEVGPVLPVTATIDHRYVDGAQIGQAMRAFREYLADPASFEPAFTGRRGPSAEPRASERMPAGAPPPSR